MGKTTISIVTPLKDCEKTGLKREAEFVSAKIAADGSILFNYNDKTKDLQGGDFLVKKVNNFPENQAIPSINRAAEAEVYEKDRAAKAKDLTAATALLEPLFKSSVEGK